MLRNLVKNLSIIFVLICYIFALATPIAFGQEGKDSPESPPSDEASNPGRAPDRNKALETQGSNVIGPIGTGKPNEGCIAPIELNKSKLVDNIDFDVPYVPGWLEGSFLSAVTTSMGNSGAVFKEVEENINETDKYSQLCVDSATPSTTDPDEIKAGKCICNPKQSFTIKENFCSKVVDSERASCMTCAQSNEGVWTALGCVKFNIASFITGIFFKLSVGLGGIVALGCILYATVLLQISRGEPDKIQHARELITSCIIGLILIIFSIFILRFIGVDILKLQDLGAPLK